MDYAGFKREELEGLLAERNITIEVGSGLDGQVLKSDLVRAMQETVRREIEKFGCETVVCKVINRDFPQNGQIHAIGSVIRVPETRIDYFERMSGVPRLKRLE